MNAAGETWALAPRALESVVSAIAAATPEAAAARPAPAGPVTLAADGAVAVVSLSGPLLKSDSWIVRAVGGTAMRTVAAALNALDRDPTVRAVVLAIDSPGGTVDGTAELADVVATMRKPVVALADGTMASAAYWIGSAASGGVFLASETTALGSIGVVATHVDYSGAEARFGIKVTEVTAGKYKRAASEHAPLSDEGRAVIQADVDAVYRVFVEAVARHRRATVDTVLERMADGRTFIGDEAIARGLADGFATLEEVIARAANPAGAAARTWAAGVERTIESLNTDTTMTNTTTPAADLNARIQDYAARHRVDVAVAARMVGKLDEARAAASTPRDRAHVKALEAMAADPRLDYLTAVRTALAELEVA